MQFGDCLELYTQRTIGCYWTASQIKDPAVTRNCSTQYIHKRIITNELLTNAFICNKNVRLYIRNTACGLNVPMLGRKIGNVKGLSFEVCRYLRNLLSFDIYGDDSRKIYKF